MFPRQIAEIGDPVLRKVARPLTRQELLEDSTQAFIDDLIATMRHANGAGLAAPQVSTSLAICCIEVKDNPRYPYKPNIPLTVLVNPQIEAMSEDVFENFEGCLSVPNLRGPVLRHLEITVRGWDRFGGELCTVARGITAGTYQHEIDHLHGTLFVDRVEDTKRLCTWVEFQRHYEQDFVAKVNEIVQRVGS